jgi:hypothetical protein
MRRPKIILMLGAAIAAMSVLPVSAQTFQNYGCADGSKFIVAFYANDKRAYLQIDGRPVKLFKRLALFGRRYSAADVTLRIAKDGGVALRHAGRQMTACSLL